MSLYQDRQIKGFLLFLTLFALLFVGTATVLTIYQVNDAEVLWLKHDEAVHPHFWNRVFRKKWLQLPLRTQTSVTMVGHY